MGFISVLEYAKKLVRDVVQPGDICIDATVGRGVDTLFLAEGVGAGGQVHGFDIQAEALEQASRRLEMASIGWAAGPAKAIEQVPTGSAARRAEAAVRAPADSATGMQALAAGEKKFSSSSLPPRVWLHLASHDRMGSLAPFEARGRVAAIMFNLGYLPGSDHAIVTRPDSTVLALGQSLDLLRPGGVVTVVIYTGHPGGRAEEAAIRGWIHGQSPEETDILEYRLHRRDRAAPYLLAITKK